jgi:hypothetical protein
MRSTALQHHFITSKGPCRIVQTEMVFKPLDQQQTGLIQGHIAHCRALTRWSVNK